MPLPFSGLIELVHGGGYAVCQDGLYGFGYLGDSGLDDILFARGWVAEDVVDNSLLVGDYRSIFFSGAADAYLNAAEILASQSRNNRLYPFVPSGTAAGAESEPAQGQIEVIVYHNQVDCLDFVSAHQWSNRVAAEIDEGLWFSQQHFDAGYSTVAGLGLALVFFNLYGMESGQVIQTAEADVVAVVGINLARVA
jgi:hypothetical protein